MLEQCLEQVAAGSSIESCLTQFPEHAAELEPMLRLTVQLRRAGSPRLAHSTRAAAYQHGMQALIQRKQRAQRWKWLREYRQSAALRFATLAIALLLAIGGLMTATQRSLPGDALYGLKRGSEQAQLQLTPDAAERAALHLDLALKRTEEIQILAQSNRALDRQTLLNANAHVASAIDAFNTLPADEAAQRGPNLAASARRGVDRLRATRPLVTSDEERALLDQVIAAGLAAVARFEGNAAAPWIVAQSIVEGVVPCATEPCPTQPTATPTTLPPTPSQPAETPVSMAPATPIPPTVCTTELPCASLTATLSPPPPTPIPTATLLPVPSATLAPPTTTPLPSATLPPTFTPAPSLQPSATQPPPPPPPATQTPPSPPPPPPATQTPLPPPPPPATQTPLPPPPPPATQTPLPPPPPPATQTPLPPSPTPTPAPAQGPLQRNNWRASASLDPSGWAERAIDDNTVSEWLSGEPQERGDWFQLDLGAVQTFNTITLDNTTSPYNYPDGYEVRVSNDGANWSDPVAVGEGIDNVVTISFASQSARYIRIIITKDKGPWWSINQLIVGNQ
jgi:hypothetical protein